MTLEGPVPVRMRAVARAALTLTGAAVAVQVIGVTRELFLASHIGASAALDAFLIAVLLPTAMAGVVTSGIARALVPAYLEIIEAHGRAPARRFAGTLLIWAGSVGGALWIVLTIFAPIIVAVAGPGLSEASRGQAADYLRLLAPIALLSTLTTIMAAISQAEEHFGPIAIGSLLGAAVVLTTMVVLWDGSGLTGLVIGTILGAIANLAILAAAAAHGSFLPIPGIRGDARLGGLVRHAAPLTLGFAVLQINLIGDRAVASLLGPGAVSLLRYADVLVRLPIGAIAPAWGSAIYPTLVRSTFQGVTATLAATSERALHLVVAAFVPIAALTAAVAPLAVAVAYGRGAFDPADIPVTASAVAGFAPLLVTIMAGPIVTGAHNARRRGQLLLSGAILNVVINLSLDFTLGRWLGITGIALASSFAEATVFIYLLYRLAHGGDPFDLRRLGRTLVRSSLAISPIAIPIGVLIWTTGASPAFLPGVALLVLIGIAGMAGYVFIATRIGLDEPRAIMRFGVAPVLDRLSQRFS